MSKQPVDQKLSGARQQIDSLDEQLQALISERARVAQEVRRIKAAAGSDADHYRPAREAEVLRRAKERNRGPLADETVARLMREIMSACLDLESPLRIAYLGPEGTYTQAAVYKHFGRAVKARAMSAVDEIFRDVESEAASYGVVPVENSIGGMVSHTLDLLADTPLSICGEVDGGVTSNSSFLARARRRPSRTLLPPPSPWLSMVLPLRSSWLSMVLPLRSS